MNIQIYGDGKDELKFMDAIKIFATEKAKEFGIVLNAFHGSMHKNNLDKETKAKK